jgi:hypothetical protein
MPGRQTVDPKEHVAQQATWTEQQAQHLQQLEHAQHAQETSRAIATVEVVLSHQICDLGPLGARPSDGNLLAERYRVDVGVFHADEYLCGDPGGRPRTVHAERSQSARGRRLWYRASPEEVSA